MASERSTRRDLLACIFITKSISKKLLQTFVLLNWPQVWKQALNMAVPGPETGPDLDLRRCQIPTKTILMTIYTEETE